MNARQKVQQKCYFGVRSFVKAKENIDGPRLGNKRLLRP